MPKQPPSSRATDNVTLQFGLISIPVTLYTGRVSAHGIERHQYLPVEVVQPDGTTAFEDHPVGRGLTDKTTGELLSFEERARVVSKVETDYGPVYVEDSEIETLFTIEPKTLKINEFQPVALFAQGNYVPKNLMFLEPSKTGSGAKKGYMPVAVKLLGTLLEGMREEGTIAVGELTSRGVPRPVVLTPDGTLYEVYHTDALREQREVEYKTNPDEVLAMRQLIQNLHKTEVADLSDTRSELIQNFADQKAASGDFGKPEDGYVVSTPQEPSVDILAMLTASIEQAKAS